MILTERNNITSIVFWQRTEKVNLFMTKYQTKTKYRTFYLKEGRGNIFFEESITLLSDYQELPFSIPQLFQLCHQAHTLLRLCQHLGPSSMKTEREKQVCFLPLHQDCSYLSQKVSPLAEFWPLWALSISATTAMRLLEGWRARGQTERKGNVCTLSHHQEFLLLEPK